MLYTYSFTFTGGTSGGGTTNIDLYQDYRSIEMDTPMTAFAQALCDAGVADSITINRLATDSTSTTVGTVS